MFGVTYKSYKNLLRNAVYKDRRFLLTFENLR